jgi:hypothetical protein
MRRGRNQQDDGIMIFDAESRVSPSEPLIGLTGGLRAIRMDLFLPKGATS